MNFYFCKDEAGGDRDHDDARMVPEGTLLLQRIGARRVGHKDGGLKDVEQQRTGAATNTLV